MLIVVQTSLTQTEYIKCLLRQENNIIVDVLAPNIRGIWLKHSVAHISSLTSIRAFYFIFRKPLYCNDSHFILSGDVVGHGLVYSVCMQ